MWDVREHVEHIFPGASVDEPVALEIEAMDVQSWAQAWEMPGHLVSFAHGQSGDVTIHIPIEGWKSRIQDVSVIDLDTEVR